MTVRNPRGSPVHGTLDFGLLGRAAASLLVLGSTVVFFLGESTGWRAAGWLLAVAALGLATGLWFRTRTRRRHAHVSGWTMDIVAPGALALIAAILIVAHAWGWSLWITA